MSTATDTLDQAAARPFPGALRPAATMSGLLKELPYVGAHRRRDGQGLDADSLRPQSGHRPRHRRLVSSAS
jgi:hypothetical protein